MYFILFCIVTVIVVYFAKKYPVHWKGLGLFKTRLDSFLVCDCKPVYFKASILVLIIWIKEEREVIRKG